MRRKKTTRSSAELALASHLTRLGFSDAASYQGWCAANGFERELHKPDEDRQNEFTMSLTTGPVWSSLASGTASTRPVFKVIGSDDQVTEKILSGHLSNRHAVDRKHVALLDSMRKLCGPQFALHVTAMRSLLRACEERGLSLAGYSGRAVRPSARSGTFADGLALVATKADCWMRPLDDWCPPQSSHFGVFRSLIHHLFVRYTLPEFLVRCWLERYQSASALDLRVATHVAAGHSIRQMNLGIGVSRRMSHHFLRAPGTLSVRQAIRWGHVCSLGGDERLASAIVDTVLGKEFQNDEFWATVITWFARQRALASRDVALIVKYLNNQRFGVGNFYRLVRVGNGRRLAEVLEPAAQPELTMRGRSPKTLLRAAEEWRDRMSDYGQDTRFVWSSSGIHPLEYVDADDVRWTISELLGNGALFHEGSRMQHCVGSYSNECAVGGTTIWSMSRDDGDSSKPVLTIEVLPSTRAIIQVRGKANRLPTEYETTILRRWCRTAGLTLDVEALRD